MTFFCRFTSVGGLNKSIMLGLYEVQHYIVVAAAQCLMNADREITVELIEKVKIFRDT